MANTNRKKVVLVILDGWGIGPHDSSNPIYTAELPNIAYIKKNFPTTSLQASGIAVGLPWAEEGNSEIGHLTIGAGRTVYQSAARISLAIEDGSFFKNPVLVWAIDEAKKAGKAVNIAGLLGTGITHSSFKHLIALTKMVGEAGIPYKLHLFTDGRDSSVKACLDLVRKLPENRIGSIGGRFSGMDRDGHIDRTERAFNCMTGRSRSESVSPSEYISSSYASGVTDEFIRPAAFGDGSLAVSPGDSLIFFNFRGDRVRQISRMFSERMPDVRTVGFTRYDERSDLPYAFSFEEIKKPLPAVIADAGLSQLHIAESEKQAHVTYFFNAESEETFPREFRVIIPSRNTASHDKFPEMMAPEITTRIVTAVEEGLYDFIIANYANADIVAHTGNFDATIEAVRCLDTQIGMIAEATVRTGAALIITADHGNAEKLIDTRTGEKDTRHNPNPVPFFLIDRDMQRLRTDAEIAESEVLNSGTLCDIAPTVLELMGIEKPVEMTGQSLIPFLK
ncbi:MAG: 2,3-bisphosphoglycerate-independent phosphoglycerate mutase [Candidatus Colwellbacteria bacterium]|nr:2,3-bisphosphoglycerate-independent phosphoglycerate mutase [Candidatus Colwellbacteria bacterium]